MEDWIYLEDCTRHNKYYVVTEHNQQYRVILTLDISMEARGLLPPKLRVCAQEKAPTDYEFKILLSEINKQYKYIYICHVSSFMDYKIFYINGMSHIYCIDDARFVEKTKYEMRYAIFFFKTSLTLVGLVLAQCSKYLCCIFCFAF